MQVGDSFPQRPPLQLAFRSSLFRPVGAKVHDRVDRGLGSAQHTADLAVRLVVKLRRVPVHPVFHSLTFLAALEIGLQRPVEVGGNDTRLVYFAAEVTHHVGAGEAEHAMPHQKRHQAFQKIRLSEHDVGGPLGLVSRPVITDRELLEDAVVQRVQLPGETIQQFGPVHFQLLVQQFLSFLVILDPDEAVALLPILNPAWSICRASHSRPFSPT